MSVKWKSIGEKNTEYVLVNGDGMFVYYDEPVATEEDEPFLRFATLEEAVKERAEYAEYMGIPESDIGILMIEETVVA